MDSILNKIVAIVEAERSNELEGSDENTDKDLEAYDKIVDLLQAEGLIA